MSTFPIRASQVPVTLSVPSFARFLSGVAAFMDTLAEAHEMATAAQKRYPFAAW